MLYQVHLTFVGFELTTLMSIQLPYYHDHDGPLNWLKTQSIVQIKQMDHTQVYRLSIVSSKICIIRHNIEHSTFYKFTNIINSHEKNKNVIKSNQLISFC